MSQLTFDESFRDDGAATRRVVPEREPSWYTGRTLSHSSVSLYRQCPQRWKFRYVDRIPEKPRSFFSFGKSVHNGLEFLFSRVRESFPTLDDVLAHFRTGWLSEGYESPAQERWFFKEGERIIRGFYAKHQGDRVKVLDVELKFTIDVEGVPVMGYIDRVDETANNGLAIIDYKTGKPFDKSRVRMDPQLTLYQIACRKIYGKEIDSLTLYHLNSLTPVTTAAHAPSLEKSVVTAVVESARGIMRNEFEPKPDRAGHCAWCDFAQICPAFAGKRPPGGSAVPAETEEIVDRLGKIEARLRELSAERDDLAKRLADQARQTGRRELSGRHYRALLDDGRGLRVEPNGEKGAGAG